MVQFLDPEIAEMLQFLDPEIVKMDKIISGSRNRKNGAISGSRNPRKGRQILYINFKGYRKPRGGICFFLGEVIQMTSLIYKFDHFNLV